MKTTRKRLVEVDDSVEDVLRELDRARSKHRGMTSPHEGHSVIEEEFDELWAEIKAQQIDRNKMRAEAVQLAAMAIRFIQDVCDKPVDEGEYR